MIFLKSLAYAGLIAKVVNCYTANVPLETRSLDEIYQAAQNEDGNLVVAWGGDGEFDVRKPLFTLVLTSHQPVLKETP